MPKGATRGRQLKRQKRKSRKQSRIVRSRIVTRNQNEKNEKGFIHYVLSCHASEFPSGEWKLPFYAAMYTPRGETYGCPAKRPNQICENPMTYDKNVHEVIEPMIPITYDYYLTPDKPDYYMNKSRSYTKRYKFKSGIKDCFTNGIVLNIDERGGMWFSDLVQELDEYHRNNYEKEEAVLHCLFCRKESTVPPTPPPHSFSKIRNYSLNFNMLPEPSNEELQQNWEAMKMAGENSNAYSN